MTLVFLRIKKTPVPIRRSEDWRSEDLRKETVLEHQSSKTESEIWRILGEVVLTRLS